MTQLTKVQQQRWEHAKKICSGINALMQQGYVIFDKSGKRVMQPFDISEEEIKLPVGEAFNIVYFINDPNADNGLYTPIKEFDETFETWMCVAPDQHKPLLKQVQKR